jgi:hypothetical protein
LQCATSPCDIAGCCCCYAIFLQAIINDVNVTAHKAKAKIEAIDKLNAAALQKKGQGMGSASERTRTSITSGQATVAAACSFTAQQQGQKAQHHHWIWQ